MASPASPPPHNPSTTAAASFPVIAVAIIGILATSLFLLTYYIFVIRCCCLATTSTGGPPSHSTTTVLIHPPGLDESLIRSIPIVTFMRDHAKEITSDDQHHQGAGRDDQQDAHYECAVCLSEFVEGERLRVIPNCCHAFHVDCIDIWLQSNANCPLCRAGISSSTLLLIDQRTITSTALDAPQLEANPDPRTENFTGRDDDDYVVFEIQDGDLCEPRMVAEQGSSCCKKEEKVEVGYDGSISMETCRDRQERSNIQGSGEEVSRSCNQGCSSSSSGGGGSNRSVKKRLFLSLSSLVMEGGEKV